MRNSLEEKFNAALLKTNALSRSKCGHSPTRIEGMMAKYGAVETAKRLIRMDPSSTGYIAMAECGCLDITVEATMLHSEFSSLFTEDELNQARRRLPHNIVSQIR